MSPSNSTLASRSTHTRFGIVLVIAGLCLSLGTANALGSQGASQSEPAASSTEEDAPALKQEELDQMLAGIALYPDELLSQVLMASTYPLEIVEADRWADKNKELEGDALTAALEAQGWDPSIKSLVNFPDVLSSLSENLTWTQKIGNAFLADQKTVMDTIQKLRHKAKDAGNLETTEQMKVTTETVPDEEAEPAEDIQVIVIQSANPQVIYVPAYDPYVVYGTWWYPAYRPPVYYQPPYYRSGAFLAFGVGIACGVAWGYAWGGCGWGHHHVNVNINRNVNINANINRNKYGNGGRGSNGGFKHDPSHRKGVQYRDKSTANKYGGKSSREAQKSRDSFRGRAEKDRSQLSRDRESGRIDSSGRERNSNRTSRDGNTGSRDRSTSSRDRSSRDRSSQSRSDQSRSNKSRSRSSGHSSAFGDSHRGGSASRDSSRGRSSRSHSSGGRSSGGRSRGGGGGRR